jgi:hypothetical protein
MAIWYSLWTFGIFSRFGILCEEKSGNPAANKVAAVAEKQIRSKNGRMHSRDQKAAELSQSAEELRVY